VAKEENKTPNETDQLKDQVKALEKLVNHYMAKANQLEQQLVLAQEDK